MLVITIYIHNHNNNNNNKKKKKKKKKKKNNNKKKKKNKNKKNQKKNKKWNILVLSFSKICIPPHITWLKNVWASHNRAAKLKEKTRPTKIQFLNLPMF